MWPKPLPRWRKPWQMTAVLMVEYAEYPPHHSMGMLPSSACHAAAPPTHACTPSMFRGCRMLHPRNSSPCPLCCDAQLEVPCSSVTTACMPTGAAPASMPESLAPYPQVGGRVLSIGEMTGLWDMWNTWNMCRVFHLPCFPWQAATRGAWVWKCRDTCNCRST